MRQLRFIRSQTELVLFAVMVLTACSSTPLTVAPRFNGVWANADPSMHNWVQVESQRVSSYGFTQSNGRCAAVTVEIEAKDRINVPVSALGSGQMSLKLDGRVLVITGKFATQRYVPVARESICRNAAGAYVPGAPFPK